MSKKLKIDKLQMTVWLDENLKVLNFRPGDRLIIQASDEIIESNLGEDFGFPDIFWVPNDIKIGVLRNDET